MNRSRPGLDRYPVDRDYTLPEIVLIRMVREGEWGIEQQIAYMKGQIMVEFCPFMREPLRAYRKKETYEPADPLS